MIYAIPMPKKISSNDEYALVRPSYAVAENSFFETALAASELCDRVWGLELRRCGVAEADASLFTPLTEGDGTVNISPASPVEAGFVIVYNPDLGAGEYKIDVAGFCRIEASGAEGLYRAFSVIVQIGERTCDKLIKLPVCSISDRPDSPFRGFLLDAARRWHPIDYLYRYVDICSLAGINRFIIHFTDDESYTLPSDVYPNLPTDGRHYTKCELRALDEYASARGVMIVPEIDMPGHSLQFSLKYPEIFGKCGIMEASDAAFDALAALYREAAGLFPRSTYIHAGGDEAVLGRWNDSPVTLEYMKKNGIPDIVALYGHFVGRVCRGILSLGVTPIVWEGFGKAANDEVPKETLVISWENMYQNADELVNAGFRILNASWRPLYCVSPWQKWSQEEILSHRKYVWDHWLDKSSAYDHGVTVPHDAPVDGGMLCAWGDYLKNYESSRLACQLEFASVEPRLFALAEILWNDEPQSFETFSAAYEKLYETADRLRGHNSYRGRL